MGDLHPAIWLTLLALSSSVGISEAVAPTIYYVTPNSGSISGGGYLNIVGKDLNPSKKKEGGALFDAGIKAKFGIDLNSSISCDPINYLSNDAKIVCVPSALDTQLDGRDLANLKNCNGQVPGVNAPPPFSVWVDNVGGLTLG